MGYKSLSLTIVFLSLTIVAGDCYGAVVVNGGFEQVDDRIGVTNSTRLDQLGQSGKAKWDVYPTIPGWYSPAGEGPGIEIQTNGTVVNAHGGTRYVELDSHPAKGSSSKTSNTAIAQMIPFHTAGDYLLEYWFHARTKTPNDNGIEVYFDTTLVDDTSGIDDPSLGWIQRSVMLEDVTIGLHELKFRATGIENTLGGFLDDVTLQSTVPEPAAIAVWGMLGFIGVGIIRRRARRSASRS